MKQLSDKEKNSAAVEILRFLQEEAMVRFPGFPEAFAILKATPGDGLLTPLETDGSRLFYAPKLLCSMFLEDSERLGRMYLHIHLHCLLLHPSEACSIRGYKLRQTAAQPALPDAVCDSAAARPSLLDMACDLAAGWLAALLCGDDCAKTSHLPGGAPQRTAFLKAQSSLSITHDLPPDVWLDTAAVCGLLREHPDLWRLAKACAYDTHRLWPIREDKHPDHDHRTASPDGSGDSGVTLSASHRFVPEITQKLWELPRQKLRREISGGAHRRTGAAGGSAEEASLMQRDSIDYRKFLQRFTVPGEEAILDTDSFDYIPYHYGLTHYNNMPFIEPLEYREVNRLDELAIAIDTSGSCSGKIVRRFLEETWAILRQKENFFSRMRLHLIQCDSMIQEHRIFTSIEEWEAAVPQIRILGQGSTDFRPVFTLLDSLLSRKEIRRLRGLLYFTDGDGIYPRSRPAYDTAFVFLNDSTEKQKIPDWAIRLNLHLPESF